MGIKQLSKLIKSNCPKAVKTREFNFYSGNKLAIDASMCVYQFLIAARVDGSNLEWNDSATSHLMGMFYRSIRMIDNGITPIYIFDGAAPALKMHELLKRKERREEADKKMKEAIEKGDEVSIQKYERMQVRVEKFHYEECQKLLSAMKIPWIIAPSEAEAYCSYLCKEGFVDGVATEDMDTLCFGSPVLLRNFNVSQSKKLKIEEYSLPAVLQGLSMTMGQFIDLCILMGCDYCGTLPGVGPKRSLEYLKQHGSIEKMLEENEKLEFKAENNKEKSETDFKQAREIFETLSGKDANEKHELEGNSNLQSLDQIKVDFEAISKEEVIEFMCKEKGFDEGRILNGINKILASRRKSKPMKLDQFFKKKKM